MPALCPAVLSQKSTLPVAYIYLHKGVRTMAAVLNGVHTTATILKGVHTTAAVLKGVHTTATLSKGVHTTALLNTFLTCTIPKGHDLLTPTHPILNVHIITRSGKETFHISSMTSPCSTV